ncbi:MAG: (2Fe-2S)-binding protein [Bacteroidales bacterium]|nr:(2Fe-2S)-binding protein [Bacteroidales bacterium]MCF6341623.1 (2Fe-2S)-binding protein [Bacteroidales bacterium]
MKKKTPKPLKKGFSRRRFLRGAGLTAAGTVIAGSGMLGLKAQQLPEEKSPGAGVLNLSMHVNGRLRQMSVEARTTLADALRNELQLTGTKVGCNRGACAACTVWIDGIPTLSCMTLAVEVGERKVTTIEGLARHGKLHPVQQAFIDHDATQCGFCTSGMLLTTAHLLAQNSGPSAEEVKAATSGNFCRCGTHPKVITATLDAAAKM